MQCQRAVGRNGRRNGTDVEMCRVPDGQKLQVMDETINFCSLKRKNITSLQRVLLAEYFMLILKML